MKRVLSSMVLSLLVSLSFAQNIPQPEFSEVPYYWNKSNSQLTMLAKETADIKFGMCSGLIFEGHASKTQISADNISLLFQSKHPLISTMKVYKLKQKKKRRKTTVANLRFGGLNVHDENLVDFNIKNLDGDVYEIVFSQPLAKGEYAITNGVASFTFAVK
ncbi:hypothetical protein LVD15_07835 [Fulvivirga maritima]|uniref:hypothetical protein n=1 Tax=Fulvivirga maritima TaxID=2904247 RepID=UPI001F4555BE|nr:hypothetical protein [Fulvivirga maritima]UII28328.1 hypothetical protein LVD15_07835 [Fulvivirga maritima]